MRVFRDIETDEILTIEELEKEYFELFKNHDTETESFADYLSNCTSKNGTLEEI